MRVGRDLPGAAVVVAVGQKELLSCSNKARWCAKKAAQRQQQWCLGALESNQFHPNGQVYVSAYASFFKRSYRVRPEEEHQGGGEEEEANRRVAVD